MSLSRAYLSQLCPSLKTYFKGAAYYTEGRVSIIQDVLTLHGEREITAYVHGSLSQGYKVKLAINKSNDTLIDYACSCEAFASYNGICKHIVATALCACNSSAHPEPVEISTDIIAMNMLQEYAQQSLCEVSHTVSGVQLCPSLDITQPVPTISFKLGRERMYVVKDISAFMESVRRGDEISYGKNFSFVHTLSAFCDDSVPIVNFLSTYYSKTNHMYADNYYSSYYGDYGSNKYRNMYLPPFMLDAFMELYRDKAVLVDCRDGAEYYTFKSENPRFRLHIDMQTNGSYILRFSKGFHLLNGDAHIYIVLDKVIYQCDALYSKATRGIFTSISKAREHKLTIAKADMPTLAATLLPTLREYMPIVTQSDLSAFEPPALQSKVYFDMPTAALVTARLEHCYGDKMHYGFDDKDIRQSLDLKAENRLEALMRHYLKAEHGRGELAIIDDERALYELAEHGIAEIKQYAEVFATDAFESMKIKPPATVTVGVRVDSNLLRLHFDVEGMDLTELEQVLSSYRKAKKYHRMRDGSFLSLEDSSLQEFSELAQGLDLSAKQLACGEISVPKYRTLYLDTLLRQSERMQYDRDSAFKQIVRDVHNVSDADYAIPQGLRHVLRNYQKTGYRWLRTIAAYGFGGILADDMGLGKTLQVIALLQAHKDEQSAHVVSIVVCPSSLVLNWDSEVRKFAPTLKAIPIVGTLGEREALIKDNVAAADLIITSYDLLKRDVEAYADIRFEYVIADEAQYMKNQNTQNAKAIKTLTAAARLALTGTPVENSLAEVWSIFDFLMPGYLYNYTKFRKSFETPIVKLGDEEAAAALRKMVSPFILRRMKKDVLKELPDKIETVLYAELEDEQKKLYIANAAAAKKELAAGLNSGADKLQILAMLTRLRQICCDPSLVYDNYPATSAKLELCIELVRSCIDGNHRVLLFSQFTSMLSRISGRLDAEHIEYCTITGATKSSDRLELVNNFNDGNTPVFLISLKAGGTGLNLTGADVVIHYDPWWNSSAQSQASDRAHRIGQTKTVQVYKLIAKNTLEERILEMQKSKADLADMIVRDGDGAFARMSKAEILELFE